ncbi:MAG: class I SAM-dependent methyltransferase [Gemmatimonadota bacterium]|nr:class I SAM-dependent methyltransferase [Gemmatimonadota bacterium]
MTRDFADYDARGYPTLPVRAGYREWAETYEATVLDEMDLRLLERLESVEWGRIERCLDLACGTGRTGVWLAGRGVESIDGVDLTAEMAQIARPKGVYDRLVLGDVTALPFRAGLYGLAVQSLADEHLSDLAPLYRETARVTGKSGAFVIVGYHPQFLMSGVPTHFDRGGGKPAAIRSWVHLFSDHVAAARRAGWTLEEMEERLIDDAWVERKPKWERYRGRPVSFAMAWRKGALRRRGDSSPRRPPPGSPR